ncbi:hypothetical protein [Nocardia asteroides]
MSFTALPALAITTGVPTDEAWLRPLIVDGKHDAKFPSAPDSGACR